MRGNYILINEGKLVKKLNLQMFRFNKKRELVRNEIIWEQIMSANFCFRTM